MCFHVGGGREWDHTLLCMAQVYCRPLSFTEEFCDVECLFSWRIQEGGRGPE